MGGGGEKKEKKLEQKWRGERERRAWWHSPVVPTLGRLRQEGQHMFEAILGYIHTNKRFEWLPELLVHVGS
jgi:hypothetical protein